MGKRTIAEFVGDERDAADAQRARRRLRAGLPLGRPAPLESWFDPDRARAPALIRSARRGGRADQGGNEGGMLLIQVLPTTPKTKHRSAEVGDRERLRGGQQRARAIRRGLPRATGQRALDAVEIAIGAREARLEILAGKPLAEPIDQPTGSSPPRRRPSTSPASACEVPGSSTTNSSPPWRARMSPARRRARHALAASVSRRSPAACPKRSLTCLKPSRSSTASVNRVRVRSAIGDRGWRRSESRCD